MADGIYTPPEQFHGAFDRLHEAVAGLIGSSDFGEDDYRWGLSIVLQSLDYDPRFTAIGRQRAWDTLIRMLSSRVRAQQSMTQHPGFDRHPIRVPIVISGVPRTGTTALHKLMAVDPQFQGLQTWLLTAPMPRPPRESWESHPLFVEAVEQLEIRHKLSPGARAAHHRAAEDVDECLRILGQSFVSNFWACNWSAATYDAWWQTQSERGAYRHLKRVLQLVGSSEPDKRWLLKNPGHIANLDLLFEIFPDARVIQTHRDPAKAVPSLTSLMLQYIAPLEEGRADLRARIMCHREVEKWAKAMRDCEPVRRAHAGQVMDVVHADFHVDPLGVVKRIYTFCNIALSPEVEETMRRRIDEKPELSHGEHRYDVADFGMSAGEIRERFGDYVRRFDLAPKGART